MFHQDTLDWSRITLGADSVLYAMVWGSDGYGLYAIDKVSGNPTVLIAGGPDSGNGLFFGMESGADGKLYLFGSLDGTPASNRMFRWDGSQLTIVASLPHGGSVLTLGPDGEFYVVTAYDPGNGYPIGEMWIVDPSTGASSLLATSSAFPGQLHPTLGALHYEASTGSLYVMEDYKLWAIRKITPVMVSFGEGAAYADTASAFVSWPITVNASVYARVERCTPTSPFDFRGAVLVPTSGTLPFQDVVVAPGTRYGYRASVAVDSDTIYSQTVWVDVPPLTERPPTYTLAFAEGKFQVARGAVDVVCTLPVSGAARLDAYDVRGRKVGTAFVAATRAGPFVFHLADAGSLRPAMYLLRLTQGGDRIQARMVVVGD